MSSSKRSATDAALSAAADAAKRAKAAAPEQKEEEEMASPQDEATACAAAAASSSAAAASAASAAAEVQPLDASGPTAASSRANVKLRGPIQAAPVEVANIFPAEDVDFYVRLQNPPLKVGLNKAVFRRKMEDYKRRRLCRKYQTETHLHAPINVEPPESLLLTEMATLTKEGKNELVLDAGSPAKFESGFQARTFFELAACTQLPDRALTTQAWGGCWWTLLELAEYFGTPWLFDAVKRTLQTAPPFTFYPVTVNAKGVSVVDWGTITHGLKHFSLRETLAARIATDLKHPNHLAFRIGVDMASLEHVGKTHPALGAELFQDLLKEARLRRPTEPATYEEPDLSEYEGDDGQEEEPLPIPVLEEHGDADDDDVEVIGGF